MILVDANLLLYALHAEMPQHRAAKTWLEGCLNGTTAVALSWVVVLAVIRLSTNRRLFPRALTVDQILTVVEGWLSQPQVHWVEPGPEHWATLASLLREAGTAGNLTPDAHLAALAIEHNCTLCSADNGFRRFTGLRFRNPLR